LIELVAAQKRFTDGESVGPLYLEVEQGELLVLLGASGSGKTTTLKMINRLIETSAGVVRVGGRDVTSVSGPELRRQIGYAFQEVGLFPHLDVAANIGITPSLLAWSAVRIRERVDALLEMVELDPEVYRHRASDALSGGQQQRVGIARALAAEPEVLLMDEPFGALDPLTRDRLRERFLAIHRELGLTTVLVTHDMVEALLLGDRIAVLDAGCLVQVGAPQALLRAPTDDRVRDLLEAPRRNLHKLGLLAGGRSS
jgi:osmoprotectant transport system ATP-binding protein